MDWLYDHWKLRRGEEAREVAVKPYLVADDRDTLLQAVLAGIGVMWVSDLTVLRQLRSGSLRPVLTDWVGLEAPPIRLHYRRSGRNQAKVPAFGDFVTDLIRRLEASCSSGLQSAGPSSVPGWFVADHVGGLAGRWKPRGRRGETGEPG